MLIAATIIIDLLPQTAQRVFTDTLDLDDSNGLFQEIACVDITGFLIEEHSGSLAFLDGIYLCKLPDFLSFLEILIV